MSGLLYLIVPAAVLIIILVLTRDPKEKERSKMTDADVKLYRTGAAILNRLVNVTDLQGDFGPDVLSPKTREQVEEWLAKYKKELDKL